MGALWGPGLLSLKRTLFFRDKNFRSPEMPLLVSFKFFLKIRDMSFGFLVRRGCEFTLMLGVLGHAPPNKIDKNGIIWCILSIPKYIIFHEGLDGGFWYSPFITNLAHYSSH